MNFTIKALGFFKEQIKQLDVKSKRIIYDKIQLIKENPYRSKKIHSEQYSKVFRIRLNIQSKETRLIYVIIEPNIILVCLLERKKDYKDLEKYISKIKHKLLL
jgi:mRNA-degrading endonuclease RelE of RelBE toxin-antitoxin system